MRRQYDIITPASLFLLTTVSALFWMPSFIGVSRDVLVIAVSPVLTTIGVFIAHRLNEKAKNPKLRIVQWGVHRSSKRSARVFAEVENKAGREVARDARATITIKKIANKRELNLDSADLVDMEQSREYGGLVSLGNPRVEGEPIPWMIPEVPYQSRGLHNLPLKHIANIGPGQRNRATILEVICIRESLGERNYYLVVFSEYGTEKEEVPNAVHPRIVRCVLKPNTYRFHLQISADKAYPVYGIIEVDSLKAEIRCLKPKQRAISVMDLEPADRSELFGGGVGYAVRQ
jgi:hypothetical protein